MVSGGGGGIRTHEAPKGSGLAILCNWPLCDSTESYVMCVHKLCLMRLHRNVNVGGDGRATAHATPPSLMVCECTRFP